MSAQSPRYITIQSVSGANCFMIDGAMIAKGQIVFNTGCWPLLEAAYAGSNRLAFPQTPVANITFDGSAITTPTSLQTYLATNCF
jgi:hypothetical protein